MALTRFRGHLIAWGPYHYELPIALYQGRCAARHRRVGASLVMKGSPVRIRASALRERPYALPDIQWTNVRPREPVHPRLRWPSALILPNNSTD
jgi:hypothetical protein